MCSDRKQQESSRTLAVFYHYTPTSMVTHLDLFVCVSGIRFAYSCTASWKVKLTCWMTLTAQVQNISLTHTGRHWLSMNLTCPCCPQSLRNSVPVYQSQLFCLPLMNTTTAQTQEYLKCWSFWIARKSSRQSYEVLASTGKGTANKMSSIFKHLFCKYPIIPGSSWSQRILIQSAVEELFN